MEAKNKTTRKSAFFALLRELADAHPYVSYERIKQIAREDKLIVNIETLKDYLGEAVEKGILFRAGKGWYGRPSEPVRLDTGPTLPLIETVESSFPLLDFCLWSTIQLNPWLHHLLAQPVHFLNAPADALETIGNLLRDEGWEVAVNPPDSAARKVVRPGERMVVLRPALSRQPEALNRQAAIEQILVDLWVENSRCSLMDEQEAFDAIQRILHSNLLQISGMIRYANSRKLTDIDLITNPLSSLEAT